jgi:hypothetical protein
MNSFIETAVPCCGFVFFFAALFGFIAFMRYMSYRETLALAEKGLPERRSGNGTLFWGIGFTSVGVALCLGLWPIGFFVGDRFPLGIGPWLIVGLLPMFFGLGLVIFYVLTRDSKPTDKPVQSPSVAPTTSGSIPSAVVASPATPPAPPVETSPTEPPKSE